MIETGRGSDDHHGMPTENLLIVMRCDSRFAASCDSIVVQCRVERSSLTKPSVVDTRAVMELPVDATSRTGLGHCPNEVDRCIH